MLRRKRNALNRRKRHRCSGEENQFRIFFPYVFQIFSLNVFRREIISNLQQVTVKISLIQLFFTDIGRGLNG